jgi:hypothetical protein
MRFFSLSSNGVGGEGWGEEAFIKTAVLQFAQYYQRMAAEPI